MQFPGDSVVKNLLANAGDAGDMVSIPGLGRFPEEGNGNLKKGSLSIVLPIKSCNMLFS